MLQNDPPKVSVFSLNWKSLTALGLQIARGKAAEYVNF